ncbi:VOC family protein [Dinoroseobacter sp. S375]|uniref:VOC family protein n=1 Tax=Dinoroseobacter sp. S375 TaxID=3415136 RepID=UPI003C79C59D
MSSDLGAFSISLAVKDLDASIAFYEKLGFEAMGGGEGWRMMKMGDKVIGLFQGMFEKNMLTFNPGWTQDAAPLEQFTDIRALQAALKVRGLTPKTEIDPESTGPASIMLEDPDGNPILIDQHR